MLVCYNSRRISKLSAKEEPKYSKWIYIQLQLTESLRPILDEGFDLQLRLESVEDLI